MAVVVDIPIGTVFGHVTVIGFSPEGSRWLIRCECGTEKTAKGAYLRNGHITSCGCRQAFFKHGHGHPARRTPAYRSWQSMRQRVLNPNNHKYPIYGGRGITICDRWSDYAEFLADMGDRPEGTTLDRIDPDGNYEPGNCRWATAIEQRRNRRDSVVR